MHRPSYPWRHRAGAVEQSRSPLARVGHLAVIALVASLLLTLTFTASLSFLWFSGTNNRIWHLIIVRQWATRVVAIVSVGIRTVVDVQASLATGMLAALFLESGSIRLEEAAKISVARASMPQPSRILVDVMGSTGRRIGVFRKSATLSLSLTTMALQFCSTVLLSDLKLGTLSGIGRRSQATIDFAYDSPGLFLKILPTGWTYNSITEYPMQGRASTWSRNPVFTTFAEFSEPNESQKGVDDTGTLLRAFLPFADAESRESMVNYSGKALVLDARVSCQAPQVEKLALRTQWNARDGLQGALTGTVQPSISLSRLWTPDDPVPFNCTVMAFAPTQVFMVPPTLCQLQQSYESLYNMTDGYGYENYFFGNTAGGLLSEFANVTDFAPLQEWIANKSAARFVTWGTPFLVLNASRINNRGSANYSKAFEYNLTTDGTLRSSKAGSWTKITTREGPFNLTASICYTAWDVARVDVVMSSGQNRTEPVPHWRQDNGSYTVPDAVQQLAGTPASASQREILTLERRSSWTPLAEDSIPFSTMPYVQSFADASGGPSGALYSSMTPNVSIILYYSVDNTWSTQDLQPHSADPGYYLADQNLAILFDQTYRSNKSLAGAISSLITVLSSMAYYDQMPRFTTSADTTQTFFVTVLLPQSRLGLVTVCAILLIHNVVVAAIVIAFAVQTQHTLLGNFWQAVAQLETPQTSMVREKALIASDREVSRFLETVGQSKVRFRMAKGNLNSAQSQVELVPQHYWPGGSRSRSRSPVPSERSELFGNMQEQDLS